MNVSHSQTSTAAEGRADKDESARDTGSEGSQGAGGGFNPRDAASRLTDRFSEQGDALLREQQRQTAESIHRVAVAAHTAAERLDAMNEPRAAAVVDIAGEEVDEIANYLASNGPREVISDVGRAVRRHPEATLGGLFLLGLGVARFLKATDPSPVERVATELGDDVVLERPAQPEGAGGGAGGGATLGEAFDTSTRSDAQTSGPDAPGEQDDPVFRESSHETSGDDASGMAHESHDQEHASDDDHEKQGEA